MKAQAIDLNGSGYDTIPLAYKSKSYCFDGFTPVPDSIVNELGWTVASVFGKIWRYCQMEKGNCWASQGRIAKEMRLSRSTINRSIKVLKQNGFINDISPDDIGETHHYIVLKKVYAIKESSKNGCFIEEQVGV